MLISLRISSSGSFAFCEGFHVKSLELCFITAFPIDEVDFANRPLLIFGKKVRTRSDNGDKRDMVVI